VTTRPAHSDPKTRAPGARDPEAPDPSDPEAEGQATAAEGVTPSGPLAADVPLHVAELAELGVLTASLLHELRQPLFAVKGLLQLARHRARMPNGAPEGPTLNRSSDLDVEQLLHHVGHLEELVEHYAGLSRAEDSWVELDLRDAVTQVIAMLDHRIRQEGVRVSVELGDRRLPVHGRAVAVRQVVMNLLGNALDAVGGARVREVRLRIVAGRNEARIEVVDTGPGLSTGVRDRLFEPFVTTKPAGRGTGLGLYIARKLADEIGGTIVAETPSDGVGTRMVVRLPVL
jgi:two-component system, NtrC family, C4-dicarboxylate transport sensor histidine kinase DctB